MRAYLQRSIIYLLTCFTLFSFLFIERATALKFSNQFIEFELPSNWNCALEGAEWVCQSTNDQKKRDAIVVLAAKLKGDQDSLEQYQTYLSKARNFTAPNTKATLSKPKYSKLIEINGQPWVDSLHLESELPNFYTRYLATVKQDIGVLVTYSIYHTKYQEYLGQFDSMVKSLKVFRKSGGVNTNVAQNLFNQAPVPSTFTGQNTFPDQPAQTTETAAAPPAATSDGGMDPMLLLIIGGVAVVGFIIYKKKKSAG